MNPVRDLKEIIIYSNALEVELKGINILRTSYDPTYRRSYL